MLKKQHKKPIRTPTRDRQPGGTPAEQPGNRRDEVGRNRSLDSSEGLDRDPGGEVRQEDVDAGRQGGQSRSPRSQPRGKGVDEEYEENADITRDRQPRDDTGHPLDEDAGGPRVTPDNDR